MYVNNIKIPITKDILNAVSAYIIHIFQVTTRSRITMPVQVHVNTGILEYLYRTHVLPGIAMWRELERVKVKSYT